MSTTSPQLPYIIAARTDWKNRSAADSFTALSQSVRLLWHDKRLCSWLLIYYCAQAAGKRHRTDLPLTDHLFVATTTTKRSTTPQGSATPLRWTELTQANSSTSTQLEPSPGFASSEPCLLRLSQRPLRCDSTTHACPSSNAYEKPRWAF